MKESHRFALLVDNTNVLYDLPSEDHAIFLSMGMALTEIQLLEAQLTFFLAYIKVHDPKMREQRASSEKLDELVSNYGEKTLGNIIKLFKEYLKDESIAESLEKARRGRNRLVHRILGEYGWPLMSSTEYLSAIQEISQITKEIVQAREALHRYVLEKQPAPLYGIILSENGEMEIVNARPPA